MITLEQARYLCHSDEPTATRDAIIAITEAQDATRASHNPFGAHPRTSSAIVLLDYMMGHMRERDPAMYALLRDWPWGTLEANIAGLPDLRLPIHSTQRLHTEGHLRRIMVWDALSGAGVRDTTLGDICDAMKQWLALYRIHFADHPAPTHAPLRRMVFLPFAVWPNATHDRALLAMNPCGEIPAPPPPAPIYNLPLALADVARALPNASPSRPAPPLYAVSSGDSIGLLGENMRARLGGAMNVRMTVHFRDWDWVTRYEVNDSHRYHNLIRAWKACVRMDARIYDPSDPTDEANIMCALWHTEVSKP